MKLMKSSKDSAKSDTLTLILAVLVSAPNHGYGIARAIEGLSEELFQVGEGALYPALRNLENAGFIVGAWEVQGSGPARKTYTITDLGLKEHERRTQEWENFKRAMDKILRGNPGVQMA